MQTDTVKDNSLPLHTLSVEQTYMYNPFTNNCDKTEDAVCCVLWCYALPLLYRCTDVENKKAYNIESCKVKWVDRSRRKHER